VKKYDYERVICIFVGCGLDCVLILALVGPEKKGTEMDILHDSSAAARMAGGDVKKISIICMMIRVAIDDMESAATRRSRN
jgi:SHS family lactate transporter-like MFS transporter